MQKDPSIALRSHLGFPYFLKAKLVEAISWQSGDAATDIVSSGSARHMRSLTSSSVI